MTEFDKSKWADPDFSQEYRDSADIIIVERKRLLSILQSFYMHFIIHKPEKSVLDLGCLVGYASCSFSYAAFSGAGLCVLLYWQTPRKKSASGAASLFG